MFTLVCHDSAVCRCSTASLQQQQERAATLHAQLRSREVPRAFHGNRGPTTNTLVLIYRQNELRAYCPLLPRNFGIAGGTPSQACMWLLCVVVCQGLRWVTV